MGENINVRCNTAHLLEEGTGEELHSTGSESKAQTTNGDEGILYIKSPLF
jgi:hypothetical protein